VGGDRRHRDDAAARVAAAARSRARQRPDGDGRRDRARHSLDLTDYMLDALGSVSGNQVQQNPLQPDLQYRGFLASPLLGAPQGCRSTSTACG
jgi:hypothetical protein